LVKIRLKRMGTTKRPFYRLVVADSRSPRDGRFIEALGFYDPLPVPASVQIDADRVREWLRKGARPSDSARDLLVAQGILPANSRRSHAAASEAVETPAVTEVQSPAAAPQADEVAAGVADAPAAAATDEAASVAEAAPGAGKTGK
jgi:small subunit ribosomal protein S16